MDPGVGVTQGIAGKLSAHLVSLAEENLGMPMIFTLVEAAKEFIRDATEDEEDEQALLEKARAKQEEDLQLVRHKHGTPVNPETFMEWANVFYAKEEAEWKKKVAKAKPTGKELWLKGAATHV